MFRKIEQHNCFIIQQIVNETDFTVRKTGCAVRCKISDKCWQPTFIAGYLDYYVWMTENNDFLSIFGHRVNLLNNNMQCLHRAYSPGSPAIRNIRIASQASLSLLFESLTHESRKALKRYTDVFSIICLSFHVATVFAAWSTQILNFQD